MSIFKIFKFDLFPVAGMVRSGLEVGKDPRKKYRNRYEMFDKFFVKGRIFKLKVIQNNDGTKEEFRVEVLSTKEDIIIFTIENNSSRSTIEAKQKKKHEHHPYSYVIIDNRQDRRYLAISKDSAFSYNPDRVAAILKRGFEEMMKDASVGVKIETLKKKVTDIWEEVNEIMTTFKDTVRQVSFDYSNSGGAENPQNSIMSFMAEMARKTGTDASFFLTGCNNGDIDIDKIREDLVNVGRLCRDTPGYGLVIKFKTFGLYRWGSELEAQFGLEEGQINAYINQDQTTEPDDIVFEEDLTVLTAEDVSLPIWFDKVNHLIEKYDKYALGTKKNPGGRK